MAGDNLNPDANETGEGKPTPEVKGLTEALQAERKGRQESDRRVAELEGRLAGLQEANAAQPARKEEPKDLTAAELARAVEDGKLSQAEADTIRDNQLKRHVDRTVETAVTTATKAVQSEAELDREEQRYYKAMPDLLDRTSEAYQSLQKEYAALVGRGQPHHKATAMLAARIVFGDIDKLEQAGQPKPRQTHQETGGAAPDEGEKPGLRADGWPAGTTKREIEYYEGLIAKGQIKDKAAAIRTLGFSNERIRSRHGGASRELKIERGAAA